MKNCVKRAQNRVIIWAYYNAPGRVPTAPDRAQGRAKSGSGEPGRGRGNVGANDARGVSTQILFFYFFLILSGASVVSRIFFSIPVPDSWAILGEMADFLVSDEGFIVFAPIVEISAPFGPFPWRRVFRD